MVQSETQQQYFYGTGKRKTAIAKVRIYPSDDRVATVNDKPLEQYFNWLPWQTTVNEPFAVTNTGGQFRLWLKSRAAASTPKPRLSGTASPGP